MSIMPQVERRRFFRAYAYGLSCTVSTEQKEYQVDLIDICPGGSRLRFLEPVAPGIKQFDLLKLTCSAAALSELLNGVSAEVRWVKDSEIGVLFLQDLPTATSDIQRMIGEAQPRGQHP